MWFGNQAHFFSQIQKVFLFNTNESDSHCPFLYSELKTLECDILNPDLLINLESKFMRRTSNI